MKAIVAVALVYACVVSIALVGMVGSVVQQRHSERTALLCFDGQGQVVTGNAWFHECHRVHYR